MATRIILSFQSEFIPIAVFSAAITDLGEILYEIDRDLSGKETLEWGIKKLHGSDNSIVAVPRLTRHDFQDISDKIIPAFLNGLRTIRQKPIRPANFNDEALNSAKELSLAINGDIRKITVTGSINGRLAKAVSFTPKLATNVDQVIGPRYSTIGAVEGKLEMISIRKFPRFGITHSISGKSVKCRFQPEMLEQVKDALGKRVSAAGIVYYNAQGDPVRVDVEWIRVLRAKHELPSASEIGGSDPNFTGGLSTEDYMRSLRG
jgi:hypothetical protein